MVTALAIDLGSSSGRVLAGTLMDGRIRVKEIHRFAHEAIRSDGQLVWDIDRLLAESLRGLRMAVDQFGDATLVSVDTWGVDFVALDSDGNRVGPVVSYRDERTARTSCAFRELVSDRDFFSHTGIAPAFINSANQLVALRLEHPELVGRIDKVVLLADYLIWRLTGVLGWSRSIATTTGLCLPGGRAWSDELIARLGLPGGWFGELADELGIVGPCTVDGLGQLTVVRGGAHDSACAVNALPITVGTDAYFISCGSWAVLGALLDEPLLGDAAFEIGITNEVRSDGGMRPLYNLTGLWILQECQRGWAADGTGTDISDLVAEAAEARSPGVLIDVDDQRFIAPGGMPERVRESLAERGAPGVTRGELIRAVLESSAARYARGVADLARVCGRPPQQLNLVGGGARNWLLCDFIAEATGLPVVAGPVEAATLGSMIAQFETTGHLDRRDRPEVISASTSTSLHLSRHGH